MDSAWQLCKEEVAWLNWTYAKDDAWMKTFHQDRAVNYVLKNLRAFEMRGYDLGELYKAGLSDLRLYDAGFEILPRKHPSVDMIYCTELARKRVLRVRQEQEREHAERWRTNPRVIIANGELRHVNI